MLQYLRQRGVEHLVHFTRIGNLPSLLRYGLLSRQELTSRAIQHQFNDAARFDYLPNAICLSISFPNYKLFYRLRQENPGADWVVVRLKPDIVEHKHCVFCPSNAANRELANSPIEPRMTPMALHAMFENHDGMPARELLNIPDRFPTNPQAEILVLDPIEPTYITDVIVDARDRIHDIKSLLAIANEHNGSPRFLHGKSLFDARSDYPHWRTAHNG
jgi:hypothetical protein